MNGHTAYIADSRLASGLQLQAIVSKGGRFISGDGPGQGYIFSHSGLSDSLREEQKQEHKANTSEKLGKRG